MTPYQLIIFLIVLHIAGLFPFFGYPYWSGFCNVITICWISTWNFISFSRGSTIFIGNLIESLSTLSLTETGFGFIVFSLLLLQSAMKSFVGFLFLNLALLGLGLSLVNFALRGHILATVKDKKISGYFIFFSDNDCQSWIRNWSSGLELYI